MENVLIKKIKNALKTENPLDTIIDIVNQYEEIVRLIKWRDEIISSGRYRGNLVNEVDEVNEKINKSGFYYESVDEYFDRKIKNYFKDLY